MEYVERQHFLQSLFSRYSYVKLEIYASVYIILNRRLFLLF